MSKCGLAEPDPPPEYEPGHGPVSPGRRMRRSGAEVARGIASAARGDSEATERAFRRAEEDGLAEGSFNLGVFYEQRGEPERAVAPDQRAAARGCARADWHLG